MVGEPTVTHLDHDPDASLVGIHGLWNRYRIALPKAACRCTVTCILAKGMRHAMPIFLGSRRTLEQVHPRWMVVALDPLHVADHRLVAARELSTHADLLPRWLRSCIQSIRESNQRWQAESFQR